MYRPELVTIDAITAGLTHQGAGDDLAAARGPQWLPRHAVGLGFDLVEVARVTRLLERYPEGRARLFTPFEAAAAARAGPGAPGELAARFAAKEAVLKALGSGLAPGMRFTQVEVEGPSAEVRLSGAVRAWADRHGLVRIEFSMARAGELALAWAIARFDPALRAGAPPGDTARR